MIGLTDSRNVKKRLEIIFGVIVTVAALLFTLSALRGFDPISIIHAKIHWEFAALSVLILTISSLIRAFAYSFGFDRKMAVMEAWQIVAIGNAANLLLPFRAGEALRLALFPKRYRAARRVMLVLVPGIADIAVVLLLCLVSVFIADFKNPAFVFIFKIASFGFLAFCALALFILLAVPKTRGFALSCLNRDMMNMLFWIALSWLSVLISIWVGFIAFGYPPVRAISLSFAAFSGINLAGMIPSSPGSIGLFEWSVSTGLTGVGIPDIPAKMAGFLLHLFQYGAALPIGIVLYLRFFMVSRHKLVFVIFHSSNRRPKGH
jgi:glycosyltransferase 2 family protein